MNLLQNTQWKETYRNYEIYPFVEHEEPNLNLPDDADEICYLSLFLDDAFYEDLVRETNNYAKFCQTKAGKEDKGWHEVNVDEMKVFIGILIYMGLVELPRATMYFKSNIVDCFLVNRAMKEYRFRKIEQYLHLNDETEAPSRNSKDYDYLYKIRPIVNITKKFRIYYTPGQNLSVDEAMIPFKGRLHFKQYMPMKPTKWGVKCWAIADSSNGYMLDCQIYLGKKEIRNNNMLLGEQVVVNLTEPYFEHYHHVFFDNFFTSVQLMKTLLEKKTYACGTVRANRKDWPEEFKTKNLKKLKMKKGESKVLHHDQVTATIWQDKRLVTLLSTNVNSFEDVTKVRRDKNSSVNVQCPQQIHVYNQNMGGVDLSDQKRSYYSVGHKSKKWWKAIFYFFLNVCIVNSHIISTAPN